MVFHASSKIVMEKKEHRDKDCTDDDNSKSIEMERGRKLETVGRFTKNEDTQHVIMNMLTIVSLVIYLILLHLLQ